MEGNLNIFENGRWPHLKKIDNDFNFFNMEDNLNVFEKGRQPFVFNMEDNLNFLKIGRWPQFKIKTMVVASLRVTKFP